MSKYCGKCGTRMSDNDFLCPDCGAIWGDRIYRAPATVETDFSADNEEIPNENLETVTTPSVPQETTAKKKHIRLLPLLLLLLGFALVLILTEIDWSAWAGESTAPPATTDHVTIGKNPETTSPPTVQTMPPAVAYSYAVVFVDSQNNPIEGVKIANPIPVVSSTYLVSNKEGVITLHSDTEIAYIQVTSVPSGYTFYYLHEKLYFAGQYVMTIVLDKTDEIYTSYTVQFADPDGNPIPRVKIENPKQINSYLYSDSNGRITFELPSTNTQPYIWIVAVPVGYSNELTGQRIYFVEGQTSMTIAIPFSVVEIDPPDLPAIQAYSISMSGSMYLYEPLQNVYIAGQTVRIKITYDKQKSCMLFADGVEITDCTIVEDQYWEFVFEMPAQNVTLDLRLFYSYHLEEAAETMIRTYYRQNPDAEETYLINYYGQYGDAIVGMLKISNASISLPIESVAGYDFAYTSGNTIQVLVGDQFISLTQAYNEGYLTDTVIKNIYFIHLMGNEE